MEEQVQTGGMTVQQIKEANRNLEGLLNTAINRYMEETLLIPHLTLNSIWPDKNMNHHISVTVIT